MQTLQKLPIRSYRDWKPDCLTNSYRKGHIDRIEVRLTRWPAALELALFAFPFFHAFEHDFVHLRLDGQGNSIRLDDFVADAQGHAASAFPVAQRGLVDAGDVKRYQVWYRDGAVNACTDPAGLSNFTNAVELRWLP